MKNELKTLLGYFKSLGVKNNIYIYATMIYDDVEDIDNYVDINQNRRIKLPKFITDIISNFIYNKIWYFLDFVNLDLDDVWTLHIKIDPVNNKITVNSSHQVWIKDEDEIEFNTSNLTDNLKKKLNTFFDEYEAGKITFDFDNETGNVICYDYEVDGILHKIYDEDSFDEIIINVFTYKYGSRLLNNEYVKGSAYIFPETIFIKYHINYREYEDTKMNYVIDLNNEK